MKLRPAPFWLGIYLLLALAPLVVSFSGARPAAGGFWWDFAMALGYADVVMMGVQFVLTARFKRLAAPFGIGISYYFHRILAMALMVVVSGACIAAGAGHYQFMARSVRAGIRKNAAHPLYREYAANSPVTGNGYIGPWIRL